MRVDFRVLPAALAVLSASALGQTASAPAPAAATMPAGMSRVDGVDEATKIAYALIAVDGKLADPAATQPVPPPRLIAQCTRDAKGKMRFELLMDLGGGEPLAFYSPWHATKDSLYPPSYPKANVTMEFLGYMKVKPVKRQWLYLAQPSGTLKYSTPGMSSSNMEEIMFYMQYLKALPTFRLTIPEKPVVVFETLAWQGKVRSEPLCGASSL